MPGRRADVALNRLSITHILAFYLAVATICCVVGVDRGVHIPARGFNQRLMVGFERTGERCSVTVQRGNTVQVSFLGDAVIPLVSTSTERPRTDLFVGELGADQVLIVQHRRGEVVSITQTVYDANGDVVYGRSGVGDFIRECVLALTTSEKSADRERCKK